MSGQRPIAIFENILSQSLVSDVLVKISLGNYHGNEEALKNVYVRPILIKRMKMLSFTYRYKTRDIFKNVEIAEGINLIMHYINHDFRICTLFLSDKEVSVEYNRKGHIVLRERSVTAAAPPSTAHNRTKRRLIQASGNTYLHELGITDIEGKVFDKAQDKYRQINQYIEIISALIRELDGKEIKSVVDMGSGKGYLTFALYDYLYNVLQLETQVVGVEYRADLVNLCEGIAKRAGFSKLNFVQGTIGDYQLDSVDLLIALHACDTATDDAIYKGIMANASLIVVAPCCHKQIRREMEKNKVNNSVSFLTKYGIFLERQAEMITDGIRALVLEYFGYKTKVFEFISDVHTPKNILVVGIKGRVNQKRREEIKGLISQVKSEFGISKHHLEKLLGI